MMDNVVFDLMRCFSGSFINRNGEIIVHEKANQYFNLANCNDNLDIKCKVLEWLSRGAYKTEPYGNKKKNVEFNNFMLNGYLY